MNTKEYDIIVVGAGGGGGALAKELAPLCSKGARIAILEWGGLFAKKDNNRHELEMAGKYYFDGGGFLTKQQDMTLAFVKAVGGSSKVFTGTSLRIADEVLAKWDIPGLTPEELAPLYDKYFKECNVHFKQGEELNENERLFAKGCEALGWEAKQFPIATKHCVGLGTCNMGCAVGAKQGTAEVQIPVAQSLGVELIPFCRVDRVGTNEVTATVLPPEFGLDPSPLPPGPYLFRAKKIILAAGAIHTTALMLRSFGKDRLPALGSYFTCHPALMLAAKHPRPIDNMRGHPKSYYTEKFVEKERFLLETCMYFPFTLAKNLCGYGQDVDDFVKEFDRLQMILVLAIDDAEKQNHIGIKRDGSPYVSYKFSEKTITSLLEGIRRSTDIFFAAGAEFVHAPAADTFLLTREHRTRVDQMISRRGFQLGKVSISAAHLMGGCRMGRDVRDSVTDGWGRVHGMKDLYIADASLFPAAVEVNPYMTVLAIADRVARAVKEDYL